MLSELVNRIADVLGRETANGRIPGWQAAVATATETAIASGGDDGTGRAMNDATLFNVWCQSRPVLALAVARALRDVGASLNEPLGELLPRELSRFSDLSAGHLLSHAHGYETVDALTFRFTPSGEREALIKHAVCRSEAGYSEVLSSYVLWMVLTRIVPTRVAEHIEQTQFGLSPDVMTFPSALRDVNRVGCYVANDGRRVYPLLHDRSARFIRETPDYLSLYSTASGLALWYRSFLTSLSEEAAARDLLTGEREHTFDRVLRRVCRFSNGFMVELKDHAFGSSTPNGAFGHLGWLGSSYTFADPTSGLVVSVITNHAGHPLQAAALRMRLIGQLLS